MLDIAPSLEARLLLTPATFIGGAEIAPPRMG
jgi:hypothetical protein